VTKVTIVVATPHGRYDRLEKVLRNVHGFHVVRLRERNDLTVERLGGIAPEFVFFPHWSWIIPQEIHRRFNCVIFHMTDLPFGRGGSPLQNLIVRGIYETKLSAIKCCDTLDAGPVYLKRPLSLHGSAEEVFVRAAHLMESMVVEIALGKIAPQEQVGEITLFQRRRPEDGDISSLDSLAKVHDYIRMLDAEGYPNAFLKNSGFRLSFTRSRLAHDHVMADVRISIDGDGETTK